MFSKKELVGYFKQSEDKNGATNDHSRRTCDIARIVTTCRYYDNDEVQKRLKTTVLKIEEVL